MGYTTEFNGSFNISPNLTYEHMEFLTKLSQTRRMARNVGPEYGIEGEFYADGKGDFGQAHDSTIIDYNTPPKTQPGLWLQWIPISNNKLAWDECEKFYCYVEWLQYLIDKFFKPNKYILNGSVTFQGETPSDYRTIEVNNNVIDVHGYVISDDIEPNQIPEKHESKDDNKYLIENK